MLRLCWSEYEEWLEEQYTEARERGLECIATRYGVELMARQWKSTISLKA